MASSGDETPATLGSTRRQFVRALVGAAALGVGTLPREGRAGEASDESGGPRQEPGGGDGSIIALLRRVATNLQHSAYSHVTRVDEVTGRYEFDCSGMAAWVLRRTAPVALSAVTWRLERHRPLARDFYRRIAATPPGGPRHGWRRISRVADARAGDVIAWLRPPRLRSINTGHVGFVVGAPARLPGHPDHFLLRIADASRYQHQDDSRRGSGRTGFGFGTILVLADPESGVPAAYGWVGRHSRWVLQTRMAIGRPLR